MPSPKWTAEEKQAFLMKGIQGDKVKAPNFQGNAGLMIGKALGYVHAGFAKIGCSDFAEAMQMGVAIQLATFDRKARAQHAEKAQEPPKAPSEDAEVLSARPAGRGKGFDHFSFSGT